MINNFGNLRLWIHCVLYSIITVTMLRSGTLIKLLFLRLRLKIDPFTESDRRLKN